MKQCPKCKGLYPDEDIKCSTCFKTLISKDSYKAASYETKDIRAIGSGCLLQLIGAILFIILISNNPTLAILLAFIFIVCGGIIAICKNKKEINISEINSQVSGYTNLVKCPVCSNNISSEAETCPACGHPIKIGIKCPNCKSGDVKRISGVSKASSVLMWGVFSLGKLNKTYECNKCKYRW